MTNNSVMIDKTEGQTASGKDVLAMAEAWKSGKVKRERKPKVVKVKVKNEVVDDQRAVIENVLRDFFLPNGKNMPNDPSVKAMQQFLRFTDSVVAGKNVAGGSFFTSNNRDKAANKELYRSVYANVGRIKRPIWFIREILQKHKKLDMQSFERISYYLMDLTEDMPGAVKRLLEDPAIKDNNSNFMQNIGHNVGFRDFILKQFEIDVERNTYGMLIGMIDAVVYKGNNPLRYKVGG